MQLFQLIATISTGIAVLALSLGLHRKLQRGSQAKRSAMLEKYSLAPAATQPKRPADPQHTLWYRLGNRLIGRRYREFLVARLADTGSFAPRAFVGLVTQKTRFATLGVLLGAIVAVVNPAQVWLTLAFGLLGYFLADLLLINSAQKRTQEIDRHLPDAIDLLTLCVDAGLNFEAAASRVSLGLDGPVAQEFAGLLAQMQLGRSRAEAMNDLANRTKSAAFLRFQTSLMQADRMGVPIATVLREQASQLRLARKDRAREQAQKVSVKVLMPLLFCLLPAMMIVVLGPAMVRLVIGLSQVGS